MTELQTVEFEMLKAFVHICEKLDLTYYLVCGSALGAVKYKGFIPWDDDVDVALPRQDYRVFLEQAQPLLPDYYFLQTHRTDSAYPGFHAKLRDSRTTFIEKSVKDIPMHQGVYIDIFPLDGYPDDEHQRICLERKKARFKRRLDCAYTIRREQKLTTKLFFKCERLFGFHKRASKTAEKMDKLLSQWDTQSSAIWCNHGNWQGKLEYTPREQYGKGLKTLFEGLPVIIPEQYEDYLKQKYGDWHADLPGEEKHGHHFYEICDTHRPYTDYIIEKIKK